MAASSSTSHSSGRIVPLVSSEFVIEQILGVISSNATNTGDQPHLLTWEIIKGPKGNPPVFILKKLNPTTFRVVYAAGYPIDPDEYPKVSEFVKSSHLEANDKTQDY